MEKIAESTRQKKALVTGASEGIGRAFAISLAERGYAVTVVARTKARLEELLKELPGEGHHLLVADLAAPMGVTSVVQELSHHYTLLVNNAGFGGFGEFDEVPLAKVQEMIAVNISALVELSHAYLGKAERGDGIIQVSSTLSFLPMPAQPVYAATKAFVTSFSESLWFQYRRKGVQILNLCPGSTASKFTVRAGGDPAQIPDAIMETPEQVVEFALKCYERKFGPTIVSGWKNRAMVLATKLLTRKQLLKIMGAIRA